MPEATSEKCAVPKDKAKQLPLRPHKGGDMKAVPGEGSALPVGKRSYHGAQKDIFFALRFLVFQRYGFSKGPILENDSRTLQPHQRLIVPPIMAVAVAASATA